MVLSTAMKTIKFVGYLFYRYYAKGPRANVAYFSSLCAMTLLGFFHLLHILIVLDKCNLIADNDGQMIKRAIVFFMMLPIYLLLSSIFKKRDIELLKEKYDYNWDKVFRGNVYLVVYTCLSFALIFVLALWK